MASSSSFTTMSAAITEEELFAFHSVDRKLFYRLVFKRGYESAEAMQVTAFWLWIERTNMAHYVSTILQLPDTIFEVVFEETLQCLRVVETDDSSAYVNDVPFVQSIVAKQRKGVNLKFFHDNRITVLSGVGNIIQEVCLRAFRDLIQILKDTDDYNEYPPPSIATSVGGGSISREISGSSGGVCRGRISREIGGSGGDICRGPISREIGGSSGGVCRGPISGETGGSIGGVCRGPISREIGRSIAGVGGGIGNGIRGFRSAQQAPLPLPLLPLYEQNFGGNQKSVDCPALIRLGDFAVPLKGEHNVPNYDFSQRRGIGSSKNVPIINPFTNKVHPTPEARSQAFERDLVEIIANLRLGENYWHQMAAERPIHLPSDRTIFLTFSKGYPIYEFELREFLTRTFGDIIEALYIQDVPEDEQPLYARLVVRTTSAMDSVLSRHGRSKFSINGKHVWARKYVRKHHGSPPSSPSPKATPSG